MSCPLKNRSRENYLMPQRSAYDKVMLDNYNQKVFGDSYRAAVWPPERTNYDKLMNERIFNSLHNRPSSLPTEQQLQSQTPLPKTYAVECFKNPALNELSMNKEPSQPSKYEMAFLAPRTDFDKAMNARYSVECYGECAGSPPVSAGFSLNDPDNPYSYQIIKK